MKNWKQITIPEKRLTSRQGHIPMQGGALNASYTTVDAVANLCTTAGNLGLVYGKDFIWSHVDWDDDDQDSIVISVKEEKYSTFLQLAIRNQHKIKHTASGEVVLTKETA